MLRRIKPLREQPKEKRWKVFSRSSFKDAGEWLPIEEGKPASYDIVTILYEDKITQVVWWTGSSWDGAKELRDKEVVAWTYKRKVRRNCEK